MHVKQASAINPHGKETPFSKGDHLDRRSPCPSTQSQRRRRHDVGSIGSCSAAQPHSLEYCVVANWFSNAQGKKLGIGLPVEFGYPQPSTSKGLIIGASPNDEMGSSLAFRRRP